MEGDEKSDQLTIMSTIDQNEDEMLLSPVVVVEVVRSAEGGQAAMSSPLECVDKPGSQGLWIEHGEFLKTIKAFSSSVCP